MRYIGGTNYLRQAFVAPFSGTVDRIGVYVTRSTGTGALTVRLVEAPTTELKSITFVDGTSGAVIPSVGSVQMWQAYTGTVRQPWLARDFASAASIVSGTTYYIEMSAPSGTTYWTHAMMDFRENMYPTAYVWPFKARNGWPQATTSKAQFSTNSGSSWTDIAGDSSSRMQIPAFLRVASIS